MSARQIFLAIGCGICASVASLAQNISGGAPGPSGKESERRVVVRVRYGYAWQYNPAIYDSFAPNGQTQHWLGSLALGRWSGEAPESWVDYHTTVEVVDPLRRLRTERGTIRFARTEGNYFYRTDEKLKGATFADPNCEDLRYAELGDTVSDFEWFGQHNWQTRTSSFGGGGFETNPFAELHAEYETDPITGLYYQTAGDPPPTLNLWQGWARAWKGFGTRTGSGKYLDRTSNSWTKREFARPYTREMFLTDTKRLLPRIPEVPVSESDIGKITANTKASETQAHHASNEEAGTLFSPPYPSYKLSLTLNTHAQSWTEKEWREAGQIWVGEKFVHSNDFDGGLSQGEYWLESNNCEPFEYTWIEAFVPIWREGGAGFPGQRDYSRPSTVKVRTTKLGQGSQGGRPIRITPLPMSGDGDYFLAPVEIIPNFNRDKTIDLEGDKDRGRASYGTPWRWWINDDSDVGDIADDLSDIPGPKPSTGYFPNYSDNRVNWRCDLVDFFPLFFDIKPLLDTLPPSAEIKYKLRHEHEALNFVYTNLTPDQADDYLIENLTTGFGSNFNKPPQEADTIQVTAAGVELSTAFLDKIKDEGRGVLLFEGRKATDRPLVLEISKGGIKLAELKFYLKITKVQSMYRWINLRDAVEGSVTDGTSTGTPDNYPNALCSKKHFVYAHGYAVTEKEARGECAEIFKRLHQSGSRARFVGVAWRGDQSRVPFINKTPDFHENVKNAFKTADAARTEITGLSGEKVVAAHSLGNMLFSAAMTLDVNPLTEGDHSWPVWRRYLAEFTPLLFTDAK